MIPFWNCPSYDKWSPHLVVDKKTKQFKMDPILPNKSSWEFSKKEEYDIILKS